MGELYHSGHKSGLTELLPSISTHGRQWLYASSDLIISILFLAPLGGDLTCQIGRNSGIPYVCERFAGAFDKRYRGKSGSIYVIDDEGFEKGKTNWPDELVCPHPKKVLREIPVKDVAEYLENFENLGRLHIFHYPDRPREIPGNDSDLVLKCVEFLILFGAEFWKEIERFQPLLVDRVKEEMAKHNGLSDKKS